MATISGYLLLKAVLSLIIIAEFPAQSGKERGHPFLFFSSNDVNNLRQEADGNRKATGDRLREAVATMVRKPVNYLPPADPQMYGSRWNEVYGNNIAPLAMYCVLWPRDVEAWNLLIRFADRMAAASDYWFVKNLPHDEVPVSHSLTGFATMYDFVYGLLDKERQSSYLGVIEKHGRKLYEHAVRGAAWTRIYVHNHSPTILLALHISASICEHHKISEAKQWRMKAKEVFSHNMAVLTLVVDGSLNEAVTYGSYTSRSMTQLFFLLNRRYKSKVLQDHPWLHKHLDFLRFTILPGYRETVGIGDSSPTWFYGPESQLYYLDRFVLNEGEANWLAARIRERRVKTGRLRQAAAHLWSTLHLELIWSNPGWGERPLHPTPLLHVFSDWGVATYGGGTPDGETFLSFKCSVYHGRAARKLVDSENTWTFVKGWKSFNPGHEHPDQGSFVFYPRGRPFITEALYGPKMTHLNNVLLFSPSLSQSHCTAPLQGQLGGECGKWLSYQEPEVADMKADIITAVEDHGMVFMMGEYGKTYSRHLGLDSVQRAVLLINPEVLLVVDTIILKRISNLKRAHAFFHNNQFSFSLAPDQMSAVVDVDGQLHRVMWQASHNQTVHVKFDQATYPAEYGTRSTNFINASFLISKRSPHHIAWLFAAPGVDAHAPVFTATKEAGVAVRVTIDGTDHVARVSTQPDNLRSRVDWIGSPAMVRVDIGSAQYHFGVGSTQHRVRESHDLSSAGVMFAVQSWPTISDIFVIFLILILSALLLAFAADKRLQRWRRTCPSGLQMAVMLCVVGIVGLLLRHQFLRLYRSVEVILPPPQLNDNTAGNLGQEMPAVFVSSLPGSGAEILGDVLRTSPDLQTLKLEQLPVSSLEPLRMLLGGGGLVSCVSPLPDESVDFLKTWLDLVQRQPGAYLRDLEAPVAQKEILQNLADDLDQRPDSATVLMDDSGTWNPRRKLLASVLGTSGRVIVLLRDPRSWVAYHIIQQQNDETYPFIRKIFHEMKSALASKRVSKCELPSAYRQLQEELKKDVSSIINSPSRFLSLVWTVNTELTLGIAPNGPSVWVDSPESRHFILPMELLLSHPEKTLGVLFRWLGLPLRPVTTHRLLSLANTAAFTVQPYGTINKSQWIKAWADLPASQVKEIEAITHNVRRRLQTFHGHVYLPSDDTNS